MIKLLATDLDGTLLKKDLSVSPHTIRVIKEAMSCGLKFVFSTGRMFSSAKKVAESMGIDIPIICCNGALIRRASDGEVLYYKTFDEAIAKQIVDFLWNNDIVFQTYYKDDVLIPMYSPYAHWYSSRYEVSCKILSDINGFKESPPISRHSLMSGTLFVLGRCSLTSAVTI